MNHEDTPLPENEAIEDIRSILRSLKDNRFWPFKEGVYLIDEIKPGAAAAYVFIAILMDNEAAMDNYDEAVAACDERIARQFRKLTGNLLKNHPSVAAMQGSSSRLARAAATSKWNRDFHLLMKQYFHEKGHILSGLIDTWIEEFFKPVRGSFSTIRPMETIIHASLVYETISNPLVEEPPTGYKPQAFYDKEKPTKEFINFLQVFRENSGIVDPGSWESLRESDFYKALGLSRRLARQKVKEAKGQLMGVHCYADKTLLRDAYCFKRVILDGVKETEVAAELREFRNIQYEEALKLMAPYQAANDEYYLTKAVLEGKVSQNILSKLFTSEEINKAREMTADSLTKAKVYKEDNPSETEVSKACDLFASVFKYPRHPGRPPSKE